MRDEPSRPILPGIGLVLAVMALTLSGCFQNAGDAIEPTPVGLTAIATRLVESPTPFVTPISTGGFVPPTIDPFLLTETAVFVPPTSSPEVIIPTDLTEMPPTNPVVVEPPTALPPTPTALATEGPCVHTVQPGEWLLKIARAYKVNLDDLKAANPQLAGRYDSLQPGDVLNIPNCPGSPGAPTAAPVAGPTEAIIPPTAGGETGLATPIPLTGRIYTVAAGDTLGAIARKFDTTVQAIREANGLTTDFLSVGQQLKIPK